MQLWSGSWSESILTIQHIQNNKDKSDALHGTSSVPIAYVKTLPWICFAYFHGELKPFLRQNSFHLRKQRLLRMKVHLHSIDLLSHSFHLLVFCFQFVAEISISVYGSDYDFLIYRNKNFQQKINWILVKNQNIYKKKAEFECLRFSEIVDLVSCPSHEYTKSKFTSYAWFT